MTDPTLKHVTMYTDGACKGNPGPGGYGLVLTFGDHRKEFSGGFRKTTNNRMELLACIEGLKALRYPCQVTIYSDSKYVVQAVEDRWINGWMARGWVTKAKEPVKNKDLWLEFIGLLNRHTVNMVWVKGHAGNKENERCDVLATEYAAKADLPQDEVFEQLIEAEKNQPQLDIMQ